MDETVSVAYFANCAVARARGPRKAKAWCLRIHAEVVLLSGQGRGEDERKKRELKRGGGGGAGWGNSARRDRVFGGGHGVPPGVTCTPCVGVWRLRRQTTARTNARC